MEKDTVILSTKDYNELRDFKINIEEGYTCKIDWTDIEYISTKDTIKEIYKKYREIADENKKLKKRLRELKKTNLSKDEISKMSWREFKKLKKEFKKNK